MRRLGYLLDATLMPPSLRKAHAIIAVSESTRNDIACFYPRLADRIRVIPEAAFLHGGPPDSPPVREKEILFVGTFEARKNLNRLLNAFALLREDERISHRLLLAGRNGWKVDVEGTIEHLRLGDRVSIIDPGSDDDLAALYARCDFFVLPSLYEGFGLPILEALSFGKPVITSSVSAMPEVTGQAGLLVDPYSVDEIHRAMRKLICDRELYEGLASRAAAQAGKFSWDDAASATLDVLEKVRYAGAA